MTSHTSFLINWRASTVCFFLFFVFFTAKSQIVKPFNILPDFGAIDSAGFAWHVFTDSNFIYVIGNTNRSYYQSFTQPILARFDFEGHLVNLNTIHDSLSNTYMELDILPIIVEPESFTMMTDISPSLGSGYKGLIKFSKHNGGIIQEIKLPLPPNSHFYPTNGLYYKTPDGHYIISGYIGDAQDLYFSKLDSSFETISQTVVPAMNRWNWAGYLKEQPDSSYIVAGYSTLYPNEGYDQPYLMHVSPTGEMLEFKLAPDSLRINNSVPFTTVLRDKHGNWIFSSIMDSTSFGCYTCSRESPFVCAITPDFDSLLWVSYFSSPPYEDKQLNNAYLLTESKDHSGYVSTLIKTTGSGDVTYLSKVSPDGDSLWTRTITPLGWEMNDSSTMNIFQLAATPYNTYVGVGSVEDQQGLHRPWVFQIDSLGCLVPGCDQTVAVPEIISGASKDFKFYPNPVTDLLYILYQGSNSSHTDFRITLMTTDGKTITTTSMHPVQNEQFILSMPHIPAGEYVISIENADKTFRQSEMIVKQE